MTCKAWIDDGSAELWINGPCGKEQDYVIETLARWSKDRKVDGCEGCDDGDICPLDVFWTAHIVSDDMGGVMFKAASFGDWRSDAEWLHCEFGKLLEARPMKAVEDVINDLYDFTGNLVGETGDGHPYVDVSREVVPRRGRHFKGTAVTRVSMKRMEILVMVRIHFDPYDDLYGETRKSMSGNIGLHGVKNMGFKGDDLCMSCLEYRRDKVDTMTGILLQSGMPGEFVDMVKGLFACG